MWQVRDIMLKFLRCFYLCVIDKKQTWIIYHGYLRKQPEKRRMVFMSQVKWKDGWPYVDGGVPAKEAPAPYFKKSKKK